MTKRNNLEGFGKYLCKKREERILTQTELLQLLHKQGREKYSKGDISKWERGYYKPSSDVIEELEDILKVPVGLLLDLAGFREEAEKRRQENLINQLKDYIKEQFRYLAAANNLQYKDIDSGEWVSPSLKDQTEASMHQIRSLDITGHEE